MSEIVRAFVAVRIPPPPPLRAVLDELQAMGQSVKAVAAANLHMTLKFLGNIDTSWLAGIGRDLCETVSQRSAFDLTLRGLGAFPKPSRPSVIWAGVTPPDPMIQLAGAVEQTLVTFGFTAESRPFSPHVTLARIKRRPPEELSRLLERSADMGFGNFNVDEIILMQSELSPHGPRYTPLSVARLQ